MAKVLRIAAVVVAVAAAIPSGGTSLLGAAIGTSAATASIVATAVSVAATAATAITAKPPSIEGNQTQWTSDPNTDAKILFGRTGVAGDVCYRKTRGQPGHSTQNKYQFIYSDISACGPLHQLEKTLVDKATTSFSSDNAIGDLHNRVYQAHQLGECPEASELAPSGPWPSIPEWTSANKTSGHGAVMNCFVFDGKGDETFTQVPGMLWVWHGVACYDPRLDDTYEGGSGSHRADDETTREVSYNGWIQALTFALAWHQGENGIRVGGVGMPITSIDVDSFVEAANVADANGWVSGGRISTGDNKWEVLKSLCQAGGGEPVRLGATLSCIVNTPRVSIGMITRDDLIGNASVTTTQTRRDRINGIIPTYRSEDHYWEQVPAGVVRNSTFLAQDGGIERTKSVTYPMVQCEAGETPDQVAQIAGYDIANAREAGPAVFPLKPRWLGYKSGDCLTIEDTPEFGYLAGKDMLVLKRQLDPETGSVVLTFRTETSSKHAWALGLVGVAAPTTTAASAVPVAEAPPEGEWTASTTIQYVEGVPLGSITLTGSVEDPTAEQMLVEYREAGATEWISAASLSINTTTYSINGLSTSKTWDVAVSYHSELRLIFEEIGFFTTTADTEQVTADNTFLTADRA
ncbi:MAG: hypothetical protein VYD90_12870 [Pseudomonadota bacterium]|nr:hypothetical protein [Pseudomonadota bacterium]